MRKIVLISCGKTKRYRRVKASDMYIGDLFTKSLKYAKKKLNPDEVFILSAKYGVLRLDDEIEPYDMTLKGRKQDEKQSWAGMVLQQLRDHTDIDNDHFVFLAGRDYRDFLIPHLENCSVPMEGLIQGKQLRWLKERINE